MAQFHFKFGGGSGASERMGLGTRIFLTLFFSVFLILGSLFTLMVLREAWRNLRVVSWDSVPCTILQSTVRESDSRDNPRYVWAVRYTYEVNGRTYTAETFRRGYDGSEDYSEAQRLLEQHPPDSPATCLVNPTDPSDAVLRANSLWSALIVPFPLIFVAIGAGGIWFAWHGGRGKSKAVSEGAITQGATRRGVGFVCAFFSIFLLAGAGGLIAVSVLPLMRIQQARSWPQVPCTIEASRVRSHQSDDGTTYSIDILYAYEFNGKRLKSNRYAFMGGSSSGYEGKRKVVSRYPPGNRAVCYVNPSDPTVAVLNRGYTPAMLFGLIPLLFMLVGAGGIYFTLRKRNETPKRVRGRTSPAAARAPPGPIVLKGGPSPLVKFLGALAVALFWNGIVSVFVWEVVGGWRRGSPDACLTVFMIPFVLVGLGLIAAVGYFFLAMFNPRVMVTLSRGELCPGESGEVTWEFSGRFERIEKLTIHVEGREEATYRRGTDTHTDKHVFAKLPVIERVGMHQIGRGKAAFALPGGTMHTFTSSNNKIVWGLVVHGSIPMHPDVKEEFKLTVSPLPVGKEASWSR